MTQEHFFMVQYAIMQTNSSQDKIQQCKHTLQIMGNDNNKPEDLARLAELNRIIELNEKRRDYFNSRKEDIEKIYFPELYQGITIEVPTEE